MDTIYTHIVRYVQEVVGGTKVRTELQKTAGSVDSIVQKSGTFAGATRVINTSLKDTSGGLIKVKTGFSEAGQQIGQIVTTTKKASSGMNDLERALRRAAIVAPVWMLLRGAMMGFMQGLSAGFKYMEDFSAALLKAQSVITGFSGSSAEAIGVLQQRILQLSRTTGESMTNIAKSFYLFGTIGIDFEKSWEGTVAATRFAMATQGDAAQVAKTLAMTYKLLGNTIDKTVPPMQGMDFTLAKLYKLWQVNAGEAEDYTEALKAFLPTANTMGLSLDETIALLTTLQSAALLGSRGGTLLRTSFSKLAENLPELANALNMAVMPGEKMFDVLLRVVDVIGKYQDIGDIAGAQEIFTKIFGGVRGSEPIRALVALRDVLKENIKIATVPYKEGAGILTNYNGRIKDVTESLSTQLKLWRELRTQMFQSFITGMVGGEDFQEVLTHKINPGMEQLSIIAGKIGRQFNYIAEHPFKSIFVPGALVFGGGREEAIKTAEQYTEEIQKAFAGKLALKETIKIKADLIYSLDSNVPANKKVIDQLEKIIQEKSKQSKLAPIDKEATDLAKLANDTINEGVDLYSELLSKIRLQKEELKDLVAIERMRNAGYADEDIALAKFAAEIDKLVEKHNQLLDVNGKLIPQLTQQQVLALALQGDYVGITKLFVGMAGANEKILSIQKQGNALEIEKLKIIGQQNKQYEDLYLQFAKGNAEQQDQIKKLFQLMTLGAGDLVGAFRSNAESKEIILQYWSNFSDEGKKAVTSIIQQMNQLAQVPLDMTGNKYYKTYTTRTPIVGTNEQLINQRLQTTQPGLKENQLIVPIDIKVEGGITSDDIKEILIKTESELKASPNYIDVDKLLNELRKSKTKTKEAADILRQEM